jgi:soluble lytic murein transglycosylase-like protein
MASMNYLRHLHDQYGGNEYAMARSYNGSGPKAEAYARDVMQRESMFGSVTVNVYAQTNADPHMIAEHVHSTLKNMAQRQIVQGRGSVQFS